MNNVWTNIILKQNNTIQNVNILKMQKVVKIMKTMEDISINKKIMINYVLNVMKKIIKLLIIFVRLNNKKKKIIKSYLVAQLLV